MPYSNAVRRIRQLGDRHAMDRRHLGRVDDRNRRRLAPPGEDWRNDVIAVRQPERGQCREDVDALAPESGFLDGLAQRGIDRSVIVGVDLAAGKGRLSGMAAHVVRAFDDEQVGSG
jgi:hypothetical protein